MNLQELNELDLGNIGDWPGIIKTILVLVVCAGVAAAWYYLDTQDQLVALQKVEQAEEGLRREFEEKQAKAVNLDAYKQQLEEMKQSFGAMLRQLPNKAEVADLLVDVSQSGLAAGLEFELFQPRSEGPKEFYAELPIDIVVHGRFHEFGQFISGLAALPRIVTIHDIVIEPETKGRWKAAANPSERLVLKATAKTYRYLDEEVEQ
ncbi:MAG TPA: pilus assembly protein PilO [Chromatiales bacterium]|nr:pilus assembly protein PilO [Chromatiales bacterium]